MSILLIHFSNALPPSRRIDNLDGELLIASQQIAILNASLEEKDNVNKKAIDEFVDKHKAQICYLQCELELLVRFGLLLVCFVISLVHYWFIIGNFWLITGTLWFSIGMF